MKPTLRALLAAPCSLIAMTAVAATLYDVPIKEIDGNATTLEPWRGKVMLIVNVASECGLTPQYAALEKLYEKHKNNGLVVLGFPCNQFGGQEPGSNEQIKAFCSSEYHVTFPLFAKIHVNGKDRHPLYKALAGNDSPFPGDIDWNFAKFLVGRDGRIVRRFAPGTKPDTAEVTSAIAAALAAK
ncbi:MAG TPA: glutathione peroxidase [Opitutaceae bacterium]